MRKLNPARSIVASLLVLTAVPACFAQRLDPVKWTLTIEPAKVRPASKVIGRLTATLEPGWHLYSPTTPPPPIPTTIRLLENPAVSGAVTIYQQAPISAFDKNFNSETETYEHKAEFVLEILLSSDAKGDVDLSAEVRYQACDATRCLPPVKRLAAAKVSIDASAPAYTFTVPAGFSESKRGGPPAAAPIPPSHGASMSTPPAPAQGFGGFLAVAFGFGLLAVFTPCVFPMIPITMSYFLNRESSSRREGIMQAALFCLGIVVLFSAIGLATTTLLGPFGVVRIGSNPWVNSFIAAVFFTFAMSMLGAFEITLPSGLLTKMDRASQGGGFAGTLLMGLTFSLTSFACVGPFVGPLLAASAQDGGARPLFGMAAFASGLSAPFFLLALFPSYLKRLPRSGGWMARVKVVMGFVLLAWMLKYISSVDQVLQWNFLTRERFLAAWVVLFGMAGFYLLGFLRLEGVSKDDQIGLGRLLVGAFLLIFAISLVPGMFGGKLGELDGYVPLAPDGIRTPGAGAASSGLMWSKNDLKAALERARRENKNVLVNFTGFACTNCHWMKANMFTRPEIAAAMKDMVLVELYTDGSDPASEQNQKFQDSTFQTIAIPYYAILDPDQKVVASFPGLTRNPQEYLAFLKKGTPGRGA
ncbi:MAG: cytochrome c biogenesis protein CcdA [Bryobacteraceae bacterium]